MYDELKEIWGGLIGPESPFEVVEKEVRGVSIRTFAQAPPSLREVWLASAAFAEQRLSCLSRRTKNLRRLTPGSRRLSKLDTPARY